MKRIDSSQVAAIGIFGGTFDPVHFGHLRAALEVREILGIDDFRMLPAGTPPHRIHTVASAAHRLAMLQLATDGQPGLAVDDREVRRKGNSYMVDTLAEIRQESGDVPLVLAVGQDAANALDSWHNWQMILELAHLVIMRRPESRVVRSDALSAYLEHRVVKRPGRLKAFTAGLVLPVEVTQLAISSTDIRQRLKSGQSARFLLPDPVIKYIGDNRLYFAGEAGKG